MDVDADDDDDDDGGRNAISLSHKQPEARTCGSVLLHAAALETKQAIQRGALHF